jgi:hypothetical protein
MKGLKKITLKVNNSKSNKYKAMKASFIKDILLPTFLLIVGVTSCEKSIEHDGTELLPLIPTKTDIEAANWKTYSQISPKEIPLTAPESVTSPNYLKELAEVKIAVNNITEEQKEVIRYWNSGGILRWNQIMRELVAKNNLIPAENTIPNPTNPDNINNTIGATFPYSNPLYAARAYAYVSVAQYDALVTTMALKQQYGRKSPNEVDATIVPIIVSAPKTPSFPSEDAVMSSVSYEFMKRLFPRSADTTYLFKKKEEQKWFKLWAGISTRSDIEAGERLGKIVFAKLAGRFKTDGMANALGTQAKWDSLSKRIEESGETAWKSLEGSPRPPLLPFYGNVSTWNMDRKTLLNISTSVPPLSSKSQEFKQQLAEVKEFTTNTTREKIAIVHYWANGTGTHTPAGHWNQIASGYIMGDRQSEVRAARNFALLNTAMMDAAISCWYTKSYYYYPRPSQIDPSIKTFTGLPNFPSYTSGHSSFAGAASEVLGYIFPIAKSSFAEKAEEASISRLYGGLHFRMDCDGGIKIGKIVGEKAILRGQADGVL